MESKKLQQLQQANSHLAPQPMPQKKTPSSFHPATGDYRPPHSPVFQSHAQYHNVGPNYSQINAPTIQQQHQSPSNASQSTAISAATQGHTFVKSPQNLYHHQQVTGQYGSEQIYQSPQERTYQVAPARSHYPNSISHNHPHPVANLQQQYQQLQQAKIQQQIQTQNEALVHQQRTFALRQQLNPPIPQSHFHIQSQSFISSPSMQSQLQQPISQAPHRSIPPTTLNLSSQCQPAPGPIKLNNLDIRTQHYHQDPQSLLGMQTNKLQSQVLYQQSQEVDQRLYQEKLETVTPNDQGPVYIHQNHPGHVVNQACQTQISGAIGKTKIPNEEQKSPSHPVLDRKKSLGTIQALKSPLTKRPASSPVTLSGWLYKQGSDGLKVWRKRWFVLSEYCLYYYKGPEEEKLLGSILLPSYKVAACLPEDKIYRKYAFKCEHTNMRTYWLAAENAEQMCQWVRALSAATLMQASSESDQASQPSVSSLNQSGENSDSGIHTFQSQQSKLSIPQGPVTPASDSGGATQPLYANAPPKPKRVNDGGYSSPSPENSIDRCETNAEARRHAASQQRQVSSIQQPMLSVQQKGQHHAIYDARTGCVTSTVRHPTPADTLSAQFQQITVDRNMIASGTYPQHKSPYHMQPSQRNAPGSAYQPGMDIDEHIIRAPQRFNDDLGNDIYGERELYMSRPAQQKYPNIPTHLIPASGMPYPNAERRTPDAYGRSKSGQPRIFSDYEDIYNLAQNKIHQNPSEVGAYRRPMSPPTYNNEKHIPPMPSRYAPSHLEANAQQLNLRAKPLQTSGIMRPHSADFLEYEARAEAASIKSDPVRAPRPKSSLDINRTPDSFYYSEASYAEKMRQSALYLQTPQNQQTHNLSGYKSQDLSPYSGGANTIGYETTYDRAKRTETLPESINLGASSVPRVNRHIQKDYGSIQNEQFLRTASARLPRKDEDAIKDGERKREESMKRLLEWKQRMLQSPLTRKGTQQGSPTISKVASTPNVLSPHGIQRSRSETHANAGYNSYSSDDEDGPESSPAGRSSPTPSSSNAIDTSVNIISSPSQRKSPSDININNSLNTSLLENTSYVPVYTQKTLQTKALSTKIFDSNALDEKTQRNVPIKDKEEIDDLETNSIKSLVHANAVICDEKNDEKKNIINDAVEEQQNRDEEEPEIESDEQTCEYTDDDLEEALGETDGSLYSYYKSETNEQLYENEPSTPVMTSIGPENHYLPMTPKRSILSPTNSCAQLNSKEDSEENPYVEMTKGIEENDTKENYEIVCISANFPSNPEPVYMELTHGKIKIDEKVREENGKSTLKKSALKKIDLSKKKVKKNSDRITKRKDLPDILKASESSVLNSESSDADDESSKEIESIKMRSRSRFSLSDTFRPASYYLGAGTPLTNCIESSDSEIVSPPPIPLSPPPLDELNTEEIFSSENYDTVKRKDKLNLSFDQIPKIHSSSSSLNLNKSEGHKSSRLSLPDQFTKLRNFKPNILKHHERTLSDSNYSFHTDNSSNTSSDFDLYNKLKNNSPSFVGSQYQSNSSLPQKLPVTDSSETDSVEFRHRQGSDSELDRQRSRRPLSEESVSEIESMSEQFEETLSNTDLDSYLSRLQTSDLYLYQNTDKTWINDGITNFIKPPEIFRNEGDEHFYGNINFVSSTDSIQKLGNDVDSILQRKESNSIQNTIQQIPSLLKEKNLSLHDAQCESDDLNAIENINLNVVEIAKSVTMSSIDMDQTSFCTAYDLTQTTPVHSRNNSNISDQSAPYYYSDLVSRDISTNINQTLNNQRDVNLKRAGISHIHNPISSRNLVSDNNTTGLSNTRSLSAEILNATDKDQSLNNKNLYKTKDNVEKTASKELNYKNFKHGGNSGLATSSTNILTPPIIKITNYSPTSSKVPNVDSIIENESSSNNDSKLSELTAGERLWEEDVLWRESLRRVSQRHARSLDDLDRILGPHTASVLNSENNTKENDNDKQTRIKLSRDVTYVNDTVSQQLRAAYRPRLSDPPLINHKSAQWTDYKDENDVYVQLAMDDKSDVYETLREDTASNYSRKSIEIDREVIRQWDSMSSGLMKNAGGISKTEKINDIGSGAFNTSISVRNVRNIPKVNLTVKPEASDSHPLDSSNKANQIVATLDNKQAIDRTYYSTNNRINVHNSYDKENYFPLKKSGSRAEIDILERETSSQIRNLDMSAGDLLSRTHEELVLLLIQLRRQNSMTARAIEQCCTEIHELQNRIRTSDGPTRSDSIQRLNYLKQHLMDLEKQYEKSKPLVNLVDNMVKLGSLYRNNENTRHVQSESVTLDRLEFNQRVQERRLLQEEQKHWDRLSPNHTELQSKVRQLYQLDQLLQEESGTLQNLQRDKEDLERALGGLRARLQDTNGHPLALEAAKKQQHVLERELSRVHQLLAENSKKLEQTVAGNARLEQELLILRQKLQASKGSRGSQGALGGNQSAGDSIQYASSTTALLESELRRVQQLVGDMQRQRQELSQAVRQLTENSNALYQQIGNNDHTLNVPSSHIKKRQHSSCWTETDLDSMISTDHTGSSSMENLNLNTPLFIDTNSANSTSSLINCSGSSKISEFDSKNARFERFSDFEGNESGGIDDDLIESSFANLSNQEKQEIKTVRIVKRESERRHRDRERSSANTTVSIQNLDQVLEEEALNQITEELYSRSKSLPRTYNETYEMFKQTKDKKLHEPQKSSQLINANGTISSPTIPLRYNDYFSNTSNPYLVSMSDKNSNLSSYSNLSNKDKIRTLNYLANNSEQPFILRNKTESIQSLTSPVFQSEAARQIISEMSGSASEDNNEKVPQSHKHKRAVPKEKRRHYTAPNNVNTKAMQNMQAENDMNCNNTNWRARDDLDMEVALRPRMNAPDVVRSALGHREKISENTIDKLLAAPSKILIPERYIPEKTPELSPEEKKRRQEKVEAIKKMLSEAPINTANDAVSLPPSKINAEKKQREHLLQLNQILAQQVMQMSKIVAEKAMAALPSKIAELSATTSEEDRSSPTDSLPIYQQRENFFT